MSGLNEEKICRLWQDYENARSYAASAGLRKDLPTFVDFYEGKQWPAATKNTKNLPRPVINIVKMICRSKKSSILSTPVRLIFESDDPGVEIERFNAFASYVMKEMDMSTHDRRTVQNGIVEGTYIDHFYWDAEAEGRSALYKGALRCETIDPLNIFFADPTQVDEQKQKWIIIKSREEASSVRAKADKNIDKDLIRPDDADDPYGDPEQDGDKLCTVLTRYFRKDGEVYFEKAVRVTIVNAARPLCPDVEGALRKMRGDAEERDDEEKGVDAPNNTTPDTPDSGEKVRRRAKCPLYPVAVGSYEARKGCIFGVGEVEGIIPNQKAINLMLALIILNNREMAWGKYIVHPNALNGQKITDEPGQILTDWSNTGNGIKKLESSGLQGQPLQVVDTIAQLTRKMTGATEVLSGEVIGANMSGSAIAQLQAQAKEPVKELRDNFWNFKKKQGLILAQFFKRYYDRYEYAAAFTDDAGNSIPGTDEFSSAAYADAEFSVIVECTSGTNASSAGDISALDALFAKGAISVETYLAAYPEDALGNKSELVDRVKKEAQSEKAQMAAQIQAQEQQLQQYAAAVKQLQEYVKGQQTAVDRASAIIAENKKLKEQYNALYVESTGKIAQANEEIARGNAALTETTKDAGDMARVIARHGLYTRPARENGDGAAEGAGAAPDETV